jgi:hypothetical protein
MTPKKSVQVLERRMEPEPPEREVLEALRRRLGDWPLALSLAGSFVRTEVGGGYTIEAGAKDLLDELTRHGIEVLDANDTAQRERSIALTMEASLGLLEANERERYGELAIFAEDEAVPVSTLARLWSLDERAAREQVEDFASLSLVRFDPAHGAVSLHDVIREYLGKQLRGVRKLHERLVRSWGDPHRLPDSYAWRRYAYHLPRAGKRRRLRRLLFDCDWIWAKLAATDPNALIADYDEFPDDQGVDLVRRTIRMSAHVLARDPLQLSNQLFGQLGFARHRAAKRLARRARKRGPALSLVPPSLTPPVPPVRTLE